MCDLSELQVGSDLLGDSTGILVRTKGVDGKWGD